MRWLVVADLHYALRQFDWVGEVAPDFDLVVIAGDLLDLRSAVPIPAQSVAVSAQLGRIGRRRTTVACSGNHDLDGPAHHGEQVARWLRKLTHDGLHVDGSSVDVGDTRFTVCPWWDGPVTRDEVGTQLAAAAEGRPARWVWIYHAPPAGTPLCHDGRRTFPDLELAEWIAQHHPDLVFCGHIHQAPWVEGGTWHARLGGTWVFNAGKQIGKVPPHITLDTEAATADWFGVFSSERVSLVAQ